MGCPDYVNVPCPRCGETTEFQSKGGPNCCMSYNLDDAPQDVLSDINRHSPYTCESCGYVFKVEVVSIAKSIPA